jgi:hypothetical protein
MLIGHKIVCIYIQIVEPMNCYSGMLLPENNYHVKILIFILLNLIYKYNLNKKLELPH